MSEPTVERDRVDLMIEHLRRSRMLLDAVIAAAVSRTASPRTGEPARQTA
ncbi:hypothetical protein [Streptomyces sp. P9-A2]